MKPEKIRILFDVVQEYYWPAMAPVYETMFADPSYELQIRIGPNHRRFLGIFLFSRRRFIEKKYIAKGFKVTRSTKGFSAVICGDILLNPKRYGKALLCNVDHGPCFKTLRYRNLLRQPKIKYVVFAEGPYRVEKLKEHGLDKIEIIRDVGLPKLDPFFNGRYSRELVIKMHALNPDRKIILYAPTYKPTSIFHIGRHIISLLDNYNVIVKLHPYSWSGKYAPHSQHRLFEDIAAHDSRLCLVPPSSHDIMPYLFAADTMISEASSVINEFLALGRCGIIFDLNDAELKHSDGQPLLEEKTTKWLKDSFVHISDPSKLSLAVAEALNPSPERAKCLMRDRDYIYSSTDGKSSLRLKQAIEELLPSRIST
jgi:hypothetical protein